MCFVCTTCRASITSTWMLGETVAIHVIIFELEPPSLVREVCPCGDVDCVGAVS
jgi:hypothetical protein